MARENQGLQIALIVFVMFTIVLGVTTFIFYRQYEEASIKAEKAQQDASTKTIQARTVQDENNKLKELMGFDPTMKWEAINAQHTEDMQTYASTFPEDTRFYHPVLAQLAEAVDDKNIELIALKSLNTDWERKYAQRVAITAPQIAEHDRVRQEAVTAQAAAMTAYNAQRNQSIKDQADMAALYAKGRKEFGDKLAVAESAFGIAKRKLTEAQGLIEGQRDKLESLSKETFAAPDGEIRWVNQRDGTVWINLGRGDALARQITFAVYPMDTTNLTRGGKKASIEVTQILDNHLAEARILEDNVRDPIMPGDKIHTPVWSVGETKRFALAGFFDIDGDGESDQHTIRRLITMNGAVVDCETNEKTGVIRDAMTVNTRYLVLGEEPSIKGVGGINGEAVRAAIKAYSDMRGEAKRLGVKTITMAELLQNMGWKNQTPVVRFGPGANPNDFKPRAPDGLPRVSAGTVSPLFEKRRPPSQRGSSTRSGAY